MNLTLIFHLVESKTCALGGWGPMFGTKSQIDAVFFDTFPYRLCLLFMQSFLISLDSVGPDVLLSFLKDSEKPTNVFKLFENIVGRKTTNILLDALCCNILRYIWYHTVHTLTYTKWYKLWFAWFRHQEHILWSYIVYSISATLCQLLKKYTTICSQHFSKCW